MKTGLVLEGGANRTLFSCGVTDAFLEHDLMFDYVIGVSAGAAWGASYVSKQKGRNKELTDKYMHDKRYMGFRNLINPKNRSYYGIDFTYNQLPNKLMPFDYETYRANPCEFYAVVTNLNTGMPEYISVPRDTTFSELLIATCALPFVFPIIHINGIPYMDGGISDSIPYERAFADGCDKVVVVLTREADYRKTAESAARLIPHFYKKYPAFSEAMLKRADNYNKCLDRLSEDEKKGNLIVIRPKNIKDVSRMEKDLTKLNRIYVEGYQYGDTHINEIKSFLQ